MHPTPKMTSIEELVQRISSCHGGCAKHLGQHVGAGKQTSTSCEATHPIVACPTVGRSKTQPKNTQLEIRQIPQQTKSTFKTPPPTTRPGLYHLLITHSPAHDLPALHVARLSTNDPGQGLLHPGHLPQTGSSSPEGPTYRTLFICSVWR